MVDYCPCCGNVVERADFKVSLEFNTIICGNRALAVAPMQAELVFALHKSWPHGMPVARLIHAVWGHQEISESSLRNLVYQTKKELVLIGYTIRALHKHGYRLEVIGANSRKQK